MTGPPAHPPIVASAADILDRFDVVFCDVWGVVHNGVTAYVPANEALARMRKRGGTVVLLSNAPNPSSSVSRLLAEKRVRPDCWDALVTSGDITRRHVAEMGYEAVHHIGPDRDLALFREMRAKRVALHDADAIVATGLVDDLAETGESYRGLLERARERGMPLVCANPDLVVEVGGRLYPCAGAIATVYSEMGGEVFWAGKPHASAYAMAYETAQRIRGAAVDKGRILGIGDAVRTDLKGAHDFGIASLFIAGGIHRDELFRGGEIDRAELARILAQPAPQPLAVMRELA